MEKLQDWQWEKANLPENPAEEDAALPVIGESVVLYLCPHDRKKAWVADIGSLYAGYASEEAEKADTLFWDSACRLCSAFDGLKFEDILKDYDVYFVAVPPLEAGRFPSPMTTPVRESA